MSLAGLIVAQRAEHGIPHAVSCRALGVSQAWFYKWRHGDASLRRARRAALAGLIASLFARHRGTYGSPRITADLRDLGWKVSENTVAELMAEQHLVARKKRRRRATTRADKSARKAPDALERNFTPPPAPDVRWCGDLTEIPTDEGAFYLAAVRPDRRLPAPLTNQVVAYAIHHPTGAPGRSPPRSRCHGSEAGGLPRRDLQRPSRARLLSLSRMSAGLAAAAALSAGLGTKTGIRRSRAPSAARSSIPVSEATGRLHRLLTAPGDGRWWF